MNNFIKTAYWKECQNNRYLWLLSIILSLAIAIRILFFIGFGLGDDLIYTGIVSRIMNEGFQSLGLSNGVNYRIGLFLPIFLFFSVFGINDISLVLYPLLASLGSIIVIYFIGKELFGKEVGLIAAILLAVCPFDAVFATTLTIDIVTSFFIALGVLFFLKGDACTDKKHVLYFVLSAVFLFYGYLIKIPSYLIMCCLVIITLIKIKSLKRHLDFYVSSAFLLMMSFAVDQFLTGHFLNHWHTELTQCTHPSWHGGILLEYPRWMFQRMNYGSLLFGYYFYLTVPASIYIFITRRKQALPVIVWLVVLFLIMEFIPMGFELPYKPSPRYPRYLHALIIPASVVLAAGFYELAKYKRKIFIGTLTVFLISSVVEAYFLYDKWKRPFEDVKEASKFLLTLPEKPVYSDYLFLNRFSFDARFIYKKLNEICITKEKDFEELKKIRSGYVVTGGSRSIEIPEWSIFILNLNGKNPPDNWRLIKEIPKELTSYRKETLKIFEVLPKHAESHTER